MQIFTKPKNNIYSFLILAFEDSSLGGLSFGYNDEIQKYGYYKKEADTDVFVPFSSISTATLVTGLNYATGYRYTNNKNTATVTYGTTYSDEIISIGANTYYSVPITLLQDCYVIGFCTQNGLYHNFELCKKGSVITVGVNNSTIFSVAFIKA